MAAIYEYGLYSAFSLTMLSSSLCQEITLNDCAGATARELNEYKILFKKTNLLFVGRLWLGCDLKLLTADAERKNRMV